MNFEVEEQSLQLQSIDAVSKGSPSAFKNTYYYKNINNYVNDSPPRNIKANNNISIEISP